MVSNGTLQQSSTLIIGQWGGSGHQVTVQAGGMATVGGTITVGQNAGAVSNTLLVTSGGCLDSSTWTVGNFAGNRIDNIGGIYQFPSSTPTLTPGAFGNITITNGVVSFRNITTADVLCNQSGKPLDSAAKMAWGGTTNAFRLNDATNNATGQTYTFQTGTATNFARLELLNGSLYRGGNVTVGSGGTLVVSNGASTISGSLTLQSGATFAVCVGTNASAGVLNIGGTLTLGGATLQVTLDSAPAENQPYLIFNNTSLASGTFGFPMVSADYAGQSYRLAVRYGAGDGNDVAVVLFPTGSVFKMR